jgi:hypothetical protein
MSKIFRHISCNCSADIMHCDESSKRNAYGATIVFEKKGIGGFGMVMEFSSFMKWHMQHLYL